MINTLFRLGLASTKRTLQKHLQGVPDLVLLEQGVPDLVLLVQGVPDLVLLILLVI